MSGMEAERRAAPPPTDVAAWMRADWDARARENARFYINTAEHEGLDFALSGCRDAFEVVGPLHRELRPDMRVLEIGCGVGRMLQFLAVLFDEAHGVDVAPTMVAKAREQLRHVPRAQVHLGDGRTLAGLPDGWFDLVLSFQVFQHVPRREVVDDYVREAHRVARPRALFKFLVKSAPWTGQGPRPDTWCGVDIGSDDVDRWLAERPWTLRSFERSADPTKSWVLLQKR
jgi:SAM-dependent methyltransferase